MKKLFCLLFAVLMLVSCFSFTVSAAETATPAVEKDLAQLKIDGEPFSAEKHMPEVEAGKFAVITAAEVGYNGAYSPNYAFYIYLYNPGAVEVVDDPLNALQYSLNAYREESDYIALKIDSVSTDRKYLRLKVVGSQTYGRIDMFYTSHDVSEWRYYDLISVRLASRSTDNVANIVRKSYTIDRTFSFKGYDWDKENFKCQSEQLGALEVELHDTNWISPNAGLKTDKTPATIYDHYEINSVYFRVPKSYFDGYDYLKSAHMIYDAMKLTPIILTREEDVDFANAKGQATKNAIINGTVIQEGGELDVYDLAWVAQTLPSVVPSYNADHTIHVYTESKSVKNALSTDGNAWGVIGTTSKELAVHNSLAYYFANLPSGFEYKSGQSVAEACVSSDELTTYFYERYNDPTYANYKLYSQYEEGLELYLFSTEADKKAVYDMKSFGAVVSEMGLWDRLRVTARTEKGSYLYEQFGNEAKHLEVIDNPSYYASVYNEDSIKELCNEKLFIGVKDFDGENGFRAVCAKAAANNEYVVILRFAFSDYRCQPVRDVWEVASDPGTGPLVGLAVDKWAYRNINVMDLVFSKDEKDHTVHVASNTVDSFGDVTGWGDGAVNDAGEFWDNFKSDASKLAEMLKKILGIIFLVFIILLLAPVLVPVFRWIFGRVVTFFKALFGGRKRSGNDQNRRE